MRVNRRGFDVFVVESFLPRLSLVGPYAYQ